MSGERRGKLPSSVPVASLRDHMPHGWVAGTDRRLLATLCAGALLGAVGLPVGATAAGRAVSFPRGVRLDRHCTPK